MNSNDRFWVAFWICFVVAFSVGSACHIYETRLMVTAGLCKTGASDADGFAIYEKCR